MSIHILQWIKEDLEREGKSLDNYKLIELKSLFKEYNYKYNR